MDVNITSSSYSRIKFTSACNLRISLLFPNVQAIISSITVTDMIPSQPITAWKLIHGLSALFGFGHWLSESVDCGGYPRPLQAGVRKSKKTSSFFGEEIPAFS